MSARGHYADYLASAEWKQRRERALYLAQWACQSPTCAKAHLRSLYSWERAQLPRYLYRLEVHHLTYDRLGNEHPDDLIVLCAECHAKQHGRKLAPYEPRPDTVSMAEAVATAVGKMAKAIRRAAE